MSRYPVWRARRRRGQVLVVTLLGIVLLVGLIFFVMNLADQINRRVAAQNAADAAAVSGAVHMARSMNTVAMNNVSMSRMLAMVPILDALPLSIQVSLEEADTWRDGLAAQVARAGTLPDDEIREPMMEGLQNLHDRFADQADILRPMHRLFNEGGYDVAIKTHYRIRGDSRPLPHGSFWLAAHHLDQFNRSTIAAAGLIAQTQAAHFARAGQAEGGFVLPILPPLPAKRGQWSDWYRDPRRRDTVLRHGKPPQFEIPHRMGGFNRLLGWRYQYFDYERGPREGGRNRGAAHGIGGGKVVGDSGLGRSHRPVLSRELRGYRTMGPYEWMRRRLSHYWSNHLRDTNFIDYLSRLGLAKLEYMFELNPSAEMFHYPQWRTNYPRCRQMVADGARVTYTLFYRIRLRSRYAPDDPRFMSTGSFAGNMSRPQTIRTNNWVDPDSWSFPQIGDYVWEDRWQYQTTEDRRIGILQPPRQDNDPANDEWFDVYVVDRYVFGGIDVGGDWPITNPANFDEMDALPAPMLIDLAAGDYESNIAVDAYDDMNHDQGVRRNQYTYLGVAVSSADPTVWRRRFASGNPSGRTVAVAQVQIYNPTSWDLWTQDWRVQLVPVTGMEHWRDRLGVDLDLYQDVRAHDDSGGILPMAEMDAILEYFEGLTADGEALEELIHH